MPRALGQPLKSYGVFDFSGGLNVKLSATDIGTRPRNKKYLTRANNVIFSSTGAVAKRLDTARYNTTTLGAAVAISGGAQFRHSNGTDYMICGTDDGRLVQLNSDGTTANLETGLTTGTQWFFAIYNNKVICCNRANAPRKWSGGAVALLGGSPPSTGGPVVVHSNRVFMFDGTALSTVYWCALNSEEDWTTASNAGNLQIDPNNSQNLTAMVSATAGELVMAKPGTFYRLQGTAPSTYTIPNVLPALAASGCIAPSGMAYAMMDVWAMASFGVHTLRTVQAFGDLREDFASEPIRPYFDLNTGYTISLQNLASAVALYDKQGAKMLFAVDTDSDNKNDLLMIYDLSTKGWSLWPSQSIASMWIVRSATTGHEEIFAGGYDGFVRRLEVAASTNTFTAEAWHLSALDTPGWEKTPRHLFMHFEEGSATIQVAVNYDFGAGGGQTYPISTLGNSHTLGVNWVLGTDPLGAQAQVKKRINLSGLAEFVEVRVSNAVAGQNFTWLGYTLMSRLRRRVLRGT